MAKISTQLVIEGQDKTKAAFSQVDKSLSGLSDSAKAAGAAIAGALSVGVFASWIKGATDAAAEMGKLAQLSGTSAETFSAWAYAAKSVGVEQDKLGDIFKDVQDKVGDFLATGGGGLADFFENIAPKVGVTAEQFRNLSGPDALQLYVSSLEKANVSQNEMVFYLESFASDLSLLQPLLQNNGEGLRRLTDEAREFGLIVSGETAQQAKEFNAQLQTLGAVSDSVGQQVAAEMLPAMNDLTGLMVDFAKDSGAASTAADVLGGVMKILATVVIAVGSTFGTLGRFIGASAAAAVAASKGQFSEAAAILRDVTAENEAAARSAETKIRKLWDGSYGAAGQAASKAAADLKVVQRGTQTSTVSWVDAMSSEYKRLADVAKTRLSELTSAESRARSDLEKIRADRLAIEQRYTQALAGLQGGGEASYGAAEDLKIKARQALANKDVANAQAYAQQALAMIQKLADAGESTYGFGGFIKELEGIELAANAIEQTAAEQKLQTLTTEIERIKASAEPLKELKIDFKMDPAAVEQAKAMMAQLAADLGQQLVIPVTPVAGGAVLQTPEIPGFATGTKSAPPGMAWVGEKGPELVVFGGGEQVLTAAESSRLMSRFASADMAGMVSSLTPAAAQSLGTLQFNLPGGEAFSVGVTGDNWTDLHKAALKYGRTTRR